jgi:hypothetical protein
MARRSSRRIWAGRVVAALIGAGLVGYLAVVGLETADKLASVTGALAALAALAAPYVLPLSGRSLPASPPPVSGTASPTSPPGSVPRVDLRGARGVQINESGGNVQSNTFHDPRD